MLLDLWFMDSSRMNTNTKFLLRITERKNLNSIDVKTGEIKNMGSNL
jgi:hypothetical protein